MDVGEIPPMESKKAFECGWMVVAVVKERERRRRRRVEVRGITCQNCPCHRTPEAPAGNSNTTGFQLLFSSLGLENCVTVVL